MATSMASGGLDKLKVDSASTGNKQLKKNTILKELGQLNLRLKNLEKEKISQLYNRRSQHRDIFVSLEETDQKYTEARKQEYQKLYNHVNKIKSMVLRFRHELDDIKPTPEFVEKLKVIMEEIESSISQFKEQERLKYDEFMHEERTLLTEIEALEKKFESWSNPTGAEPAIGVSNTPLKSARDISKSLPPEVAAFDKFLQQTGGVRGGWDEYDHATFLKLIVKYKKHDQFMKEAIHSIPTRTEEQISEHKDWHEEYLRMQEVKKQAIAKWKEEKEVEKDDQLAIAGKNQEKEKQLERKKAEDYQKQIEAEKRANRDRLRAWKDDQKRQKEFEASKKRREEKKRLAEEEAKRRKHFELKSQVEEFKRKRAEESESRALQEEALRLAEEEERRRLVAEKAEQIQERSNKMLESKKAASEAKLKAEIEKKERLEKLKGSVKVEASSDPSRLLKPTEGWKERQKQEDQTPSAGRVYSMPHRAVPSWRQGVH